MSDPNTNAAPDLSMPHIAQSVEDAKKAIKKRLEPKSAEEDGWEPQDPRAKEVYTFRFEYTDTQGKVWRGHFQNHARTIMDRQAQANMQAAWQGGIPHNAYDPEGAFLNEILAHMSITLKPVEGSNSFDIDDVRRATDIDLVNKLYEEVIGHEARFHRRRKAQEGGEEARGG